MKTMSILSAGKARLACFQIFFISSLVPQPHELRISIFIRIACAKFSVSTKALKWPRWLGDIKVQLSAYVKGVTCSTDIRLKKVAAMTSVAQTDIESPSGALW